MRILTLMIFFVSLAGCFDTSETNTGDSNSTGKETKANADSKDKCSDRTKAEETWMTACPEGVNAQYFINAPNVDRTQLGGKMRVYCECIKNNYEIIDLAPKDCTFDDGNVMPILNGLYSKAVGRCGKQVER